MSVLGKIKKVIFNKRKSILLILAGLLFISFNSYAQTYVLPDTNLRNKLIANYPFVMTGNLLNIPAAQSYTGTLNLSNANISNADGIQHFSNISNLNLNLNQLTTLPDISGLTQLVGLYLCNNQFTTLPSLSTFSNLGDFQASYNKLTSLPSLTANTNLVYIYCQINQLTSLPDLSTLTKLKVLDVGQNNLGQLPDLSSLTALKELHVHKTGIDTIIGLSSLTNLTMLYAWGNRIRDLSELNSNTTLTTFQVFDNELKSLPDLSNKPSLTNGTFLNNRLSFEDLLPLTSLANFGAFNYNPQKPVPLPSTTIREKESVSFNTSIDLTTTTNLYTWYKEGTLLTTNTTGGYSISSASYADSGKYYVQITNPGLPGLTLLSDTSILTIKPCLVIKHFNKEVLSEDCKEGMALQFTAFQLGGGTAPYDYGLVKSGKTDTLFTTTPQFQSLTPGIYSLIVKDSKMCLAVTKNISIKSPAECQIIISPNGDGIMDTYFIEEPGIVKIYDISRTLINVLNSPIEWDGRKTDGTIASDGYYSILLNDKKVIHVTIVK